MQQWHAPPPTSNIGCHNSSKSNSNRQADAGLAAEDAAEDAATVEYPFNRAYLCNTALTKAVAANKMCSRSNIQGASGRNPSSSNTSKGSNSSKGNTRAIIRAVMPSSKWLECRC